MKGRLFGKRGVFISLVPAQKKKRGNRQKKTGKRKKQRKLRGNQSPSHKKKKRNYTRKTKRRGATAPNNLKKAFSLKKEGNQAKKAICGKRKKKTKRGRGKREIKTNRAKAAVGDEVGESNQERQPGKDGEGKKGNAVRKKKNVMPSLPTTMGGGVPQDHLDSLKKGIGACSRTVEGEGG